MNPVTATSVHQDSSAKCMIRVDAFNLHVDPVRTEMIGTKNILILHVCDLDKRKSKEILSDKKLS